MFMEAFLTNELGHVGLGLGFYVTFACLFLTVATLFVSRVSFFCMYFLLVLCVWLSIDCLERPLPSRPHPSYVACLEVKRKYYQNCSELDCVTQCSQSGAHLCEQFLQVKQIVFVTLQPLHCA